MQSFVFVIMPFLMMGAVGVGALMWGGGKLLASLQVRQQQKALQTDLLRTTSLLKEIEGFAVQDVSVRLGLGEDVLDRINNLVRQNELIYNERKAL